jgi:hypothetical protein
MSQRIVEPCVEWAARLALRPGDLSPSEQAARQAHLRECAACAATFADYQDLIARVRALPLPEARPSLLPDLFTVQGSQKRGNMLNESKSIEEQQEQAAGESEMPIQLFQARKRPVRRRVMALVAVLLVGVLVGGFALLTTRNGGVGAGAFSLYRGWTQVTLYQGTGSQTIAIGNLQMPRLWGYAYACEGSGSLSIRMIGTAYTGETGTDKCTSAASVSPMSLSLMLKPVDLQTIKVTANVSTRWSFQIVEETVQPSWPLRTSSWISGTGAGGGWNNSTPLRGNVLPLYNEAGQQFVPKVWGLLLVCIGAGHGSVQLNPGGGTISFPACDGQPKFTPVRYSAATQVDEFQVNVTGNMLWSVLIIGCTSADITGCQ